MNGLLAGVWTWERDGGRLGVTVEPFRSLSARTRKAVPEEVPRMDESAGVRRTTWMRSGKR